MTTVAAGENLLVGTLGGKTFKAPSAWGVSSSWLASLLLRTKKLEGIQRTNNDLTLFCWIHGEIDVTKHDGDELQEVQTG